MTDLPEGFSAYVAGVGTSAAGGVHHLVVIAGDDAAAAAGVFTKSRFAGPSVTISRERVARGTARAVVVIAKNANVATGSAGHDDALEVTRLVAGRIGCEPSEVLIASTGVIGRRYPMDRVRAGIAAIPNQLPLRVAEPAASGMMTTDTVPKIAAAAVSGSPARVVGIAKGAGMIEPDMATMIALVTTDAEVDGKRLDGVFRSVVERTFNCVSVDTDTSTSDTAIALASGRAGAVDPAALETAVEDVCAQLVRQIAADGEGAQTLIEVLVDGARDRAQAKRVGKSIVNSPLVKTAVHGADPNWGRVAMAIGKCSDDTDIDPAQVVIRFGDREVYPAVLDDGGLAELSAYLAGDEVLIHVSLDIADAACTVWGCDLTAGYVRINADYTS